MTTSDHEMLRHLISLGGYDNSHAALAIGWMEELNCDTSDLREDRVRAIKRMNADLQRQKYPGDLKLELVAILSYLGEDSESHSPLLSEIITRYQNWSAQDVVDDWHLSLMIIWSIAVLSLGSATKPMLGFISAPD